MRERRREIGFLGEESVTGVDGLSAGADRRPNDRVDVEIALSRRRRADADGHVGLCDVAGAGVGIAVDRDRSDSHGAQRTDDADGDLAAVGHQNGIEESHRHIRNTP